MTQLDDTADAHDTPVYIDLSHKMQVGMQVYPGANGFRMRPAATIPKNGYNASEIAFSSHTGTHIDAPYHFIEDGMTIDEIPLSMLTGPALVVDLTHKGPREGIVWADLEPYEDRMKPGIILCLYTGWDKYYNTPKYIEHPYLAPDAAKRIMKTGLRVVGVDFFGTDATPVKSPDEFVAHQIMLGAGGINIENMRGLGQILGRNATVAAIPLSIAGGDGCPVRAYATLH
jgi:kynurenine formamidase